jgi:tetratricopeptide (TPR) repeat protein
MIFFRARRYDESIHASQQALEFDPGFVQALWWQGVSYAGKRDFPRSVAALTKALNIADGPLFRGYLGFVYGQARERDKAVGILKELAMMSRQRWVTPIDYALVYAGLGDADSTFAWLEKAYQAHEMRFELASFYYDTFRSDPRFAALVRRLGLSFPVSAPK